MEVDSPSVVPPLSRVTAPFSVLLHIYWPHGRRSISSIWVLGIGYSLFPSRVLRDEDRVLLLERRQGIPLCFHSCLLNKCQLHYYYYYLVFNYTTSLPFSLYPSLFKREKCQQRLSRGLISVHQRERIEELI